MALGHRTGRANPGRGRRAWLDVVALRAHRANRDRPYQPGPGAVRAGAHRQPETGRTAEAGKQSRAEQLDMGPPVGRPAGAAAGLRIGPRVAEGPQTPSAAAVLDLLEPQRVPAGS